jgi:hypothetical protein
MGSQRRETQQKVPQHRWSGMTEPDNTSKAASREDDPRQTSRDERLENLVDDLQDNVAGEREAERVPGNAKSVRSQQSVSGEEPPD